MSHFSHYFQTSVGSKVVMAVTGILLFLFLIAHLLGNLLVFAGSDATNAYGHGLREMPALLWIARLGLLLVFILHVASAIRVSRLNRDARPVPYVVLSTIETTFAARTILMSGLIVLAFVVYHLLHFTLGVTNPEYLQLVDSHGRADVYRMVVTGFQNVVVSVVYIIAMLLLAMHLSHGVTSFFQSIGLNHPRYNRLFKRLGPISAIIIFIGFVSIPFSVLSGMVKVP